MVDPVWKKWFECVTASSASLRGRGLSTLLVLKDQWSSSGNLVMTVSCFGGLLSARDTTSTNRLTMGLPVPLSGDFGIEPDTCTTFKTHLKAQQRQI